MTEFDLAARFDLLVVRGFFDARACEEIVCAMRSARGGAATVYGRGAAGSVDERARKVERLKTPPETVEFVRERLLARKREVEEHFHLSLDGCEEPQFLRYRVGDFFVAHQDGNTGLLRLEQEERRVSVVIFLSRQAEAPKEGAYCGGSLVLHDWGPGRSGEQLRLSGEPGTLVAFRSETTHEVTPVTYGERLSIACWYR